MFNGNKITTIIRRQTDCSTNKITSVMEQRKCFKKEGSTIIRMQNKTPSMQVLPFLKCKPTSLPAAEWKPSLT